MANRASVSIEPGSALKIPLDAERLRRILELFCKVGGQNNARLELAVTDDARMETLHRQSLNRKGPTNILSFPAKGSLGGNSPGLSGKLSGELSGELSGDLSGELPERLSRAPKTKEAVFLGSLVLSADTLEREAFLYGQDAADYCLRLLAHGFAHLLGHGHGPEMAKFEEGLAEAGRTLV
ncbi:MAG: rRNA maturation RNase YbeY [Desulfovibrio sp.]|jgi:probable rRNA maturation factor|nr:rRNA maturation RNase YbeY [Desulfovibrio sp.]